MRLFGVVAVVVLSVGCGTAPAQCGPTNCSGCCDTSGKCVTLTTEKACGANGSTCSLCGLNQSCSLGACVGGFVNGGGTSGGSANGGGSANAGGSANGGGSANAGGSANGGGSASAGGSAVAGGSTAGGASAGGGAVGGGIAGGTGLNAELLFIVDISGSMNTPVDPTNSTCGGCTGAACPVTCPTRVSVLRNALRSYLTANPTRARYGAVAFPEQVTFTPTGCAPAASQAVPMLAPSVASTSSVLMAQTQAMQTFVSGIGTTTVVSGGTPTGPTLAYAATIPAIASSTLPRGIVLITDGLPNCNLNNPLSCTSMPLPPADLCTISATGCTGTYCRAGYLDQTGTVQAVASLRFSGVRTAVVVIGPPNPQVTTTMNAMADEGGATACSVSNPGCLQRFFPANDETTLTQAITAAVARAAAP